MHALRNLWAHWLDFSYWLKINPTRYRIACVVLLPTVPVAALGIGAWATVYSLYALLRDGIRAFIAGEPQ